VLARVGLGEPGEVPLASPPGPLREHGEGETSLGDSKGGVGRAREARADGFAATIRPRARTVGSACLRDARETPPFVWGDFGGAAVNAAG